MTPTGPAAAGASEGPAGPLRGTRIVEMAGLGALPFCAMLFADMGADILTVAPPAARENTVPEQRASHHADPVWRGRSRLALDLKASGTVNLLLRIVARADVLVEAFRPGVMERLGLGPEACLAVNPRLVYGRMTGWGQEGPLAQVPGHDANYMAITGALDSIGYPDRPPVQPLNLVGDLGGGALYLATGVLAALLHARAGGAGQVVDAAMVDGIGSLMTQFYGMRAAGRWNDERRSNAIGGGAPYSTVYETADGKHVAVIAVEDKFYRALLGKLGLREEDLPARGNREHWPALRERFAAIFRGRTRREWAELLEHDEACVSPVLDMAEAPLHPHNVARAAFASYDGQPIPAAAPRFLGTPTAHAPRSRGPAATLLSSWGVDDKSIKAVEALTRVAP